MPELRTVAVADIVVGDRVRRELGNVLGLAESIRRVGLLHPPVVNSRMQLIAGRRRLEAVRKLFWTDVPVLVADTLDDALTAIKAELYENTDREPLAPTEMVAAGKKIEELERPEAERRKKSGQNQHSEPSGNLPEGSRGDTRDKVAAALDVGARTYEKAKAVVAAAEADPEQFGDLPGQMDATGKIDPAYQELRARQEHISSAHQVTPEPAGTNDAPPDYSTAEPGYESGPETGPEPSAEDDDDEQSPPAVSGAPPAGLNPTDHTRGPAKPRKEYPEPVAGLLRDFTALAVKLGKFVNSPEGEKFTHYVGQLVKAGVIPQPGLIRHRDAFVNGRKYKRSWTGFAGVRYLLKLSTQDRTCQFSTLKRGFQEAVTGEGDEE